MANWLRILLIMVAALVAIINAVFFYRGETILFPPEGASDQVSAEYHLGSSTFNWEQSVVQKKIHSLLAESAIDGGLTQSWRGTSEEGWCVVIELLRIGSDAEADYVWDKLSSAIMRSFPGSQQAGLTLSSSEWSSTFLSAVIVESVSRLASLLVAVLAIVLLVKYRPPLKSHLPTIESSSPV